MKQIRLKCKILKVTGCKSCPCSGIDGPCDETWPVCRATVDHNNIIGFDYSDKEPPHFCPLEDA